MPIRDATLRDAAFIAYLDEQCFSVYNGPHYLTALKMMMFPDTVSLIYAEENGGRQVGFAIMQLDKSYISEIAVTASHRKRGIGRALLEECERRVLQSGSNWLQLHVAEDNPTAQKVFKDFGFEFGSDPSIPFRGNRVQALHMIKHLKPASQTGPE
jgi:ribosomal protein S18 acetylase RimI-like enzyme